MKTKIIFKTFYRCFLITMVLALSSCIPFTGLPQSYAVEKIFITDYKDFGPSQLSSRLLGKKQWQWDTPENHLPVNYDVKVVVYRDISLEKVKKLYPVDPYQKQDYRYIEYGEARAYLSETILYFQNELESSSTPELYP